MIDLSRLDLEPLRPHADIDISCEVGLVDPRLDAWFISPLAHGGRAAVGIWWPELFKAGRPDLLARSEPQGRSGEE